MLQRLSGTVDEEFYPGCGLWSRSQFEAMDSAFCARVEAAFQAGLESRKAAAATVRTVRNGDARQVEAAIEAGWQELCRLRGEISFSEIVQFVRKRCLVDPEVIRMGFAQRLRERGSEFWADSAPDLLAPKVDAAIRSNGSRRGGDHAQNTQRAAMSGCRKIGRAAGKLKSVREKSGRSVMKEAAKITAAEGEGGAGS